ncbi:formimidoylglutamase [Sphingobacterium sp. SRCM116780]|uniref:formimidoylglutamase n=1 Tax=Sphingobacterium sp. SRCM116780 TaxID=2907623 RepID=UPI001F451CE8|nr:formimidoylglutamase [Sphingobacterium sp. SRCM116780]UIR55575.1 formimidoylglutamase [Sphingobacterium sp. SRCM116780]
MSLSVFFTPIATQEFFPEEGFLRSQLGNVFRIYQDQFPTWDREDRPQVAIVGVEDDRAAVYNQGCAKAPDAVRKHLYTLYQGDYAINAVDLGNIKAGASLADTYAALKAVVEELLAENILPIIIGGGQDLTYAQYLGYQSRGQKIEVAVVDARFDLDQESSEQVELNSNSYLNHIILHEPDYLFNLNNIAYQTYLVSKESINMYDKLFFNATRVGALAGRMDQSEPLLRAADMVSFDIGAIRSSEAPGNANAMPNGLYGDEACQIARYAGMSDKCSSIGFYEVNPTFDPMEQTAMLVAQMIWCFIDGFYNRKQDTPLFPKSSYIIYRTTLENEEHELVFVKSKKSDRWWMQVPYFGSRSVNERYHLVPCRYEDYQTAVTGEMPDLWWRTHQKLQ